MTERTTTHITQVANVGVPVANQDRALEFYVDRLGFEKRLDVPFGNGLRWIEVAPPGAATTIALLPRGSDVGGSDVGGTDVPQGSDARTGVDTGIRLWTTDADADHRDLTGRGVDTDPDVMRWPGVPPMFSFRDLDGNTLYIVERN